ncbi:MAG: 3-phosphoserine/phosphohydroxythreonine transaminase [Myxococcales bacterium]|nr:3-phosphoserine/phosphohydroxythreonine transaminase [Myxococcales bacterium]
MPHYNFSAGPSSLPAVVADRVAVSFRDFRGTGIGIAEHSHRGAAFEGLLRETEGLVRRLADVPSDYAVMFMPGGGSLQFYGVPLNFLVPGRTADYCVTGHWSKKAYYDAVAIGQTHVACSSEDVRHVRIPAQVTTSANPVYLHYCTNNTIYGTQWQAPPTVPSDVPLVADISSDMFSRPPRVAEHAMVYACAQKNLGIAGVTLVIAKRDFIATGRRDLPAMLQYRTFDEQGSMPNTPPTFAIYVMYEMLTWIAEQGGVVGLQARAQQKSSLLYSFIDATPFYTGHAEAGSRSQMNVTFRCATPELDAKLLAEATAAGFVYLAGHRSAGGMRASIYNAMPLETVATLVQFLADFARKN